MENLFRDLFRKRTGSKPTDAEPENGLHHQLTTPISRKVLMITHNPILKSQGSRTLKEYFGWNDPDALAKGYVDDIRECSFGYANYEIVERLVVDGYPIKRDGFRYTEQT